MGEHPRLARSGAGDDEQRPAAVDDGVELVGVEPGERVAAAVAGVGALLSGFSVTGNPSYEWLVTPVVDCGTVQCRSEIWGTSVSDADTRFPQMGARC